MSDEEEYEFEYEDEDEEMDEEEADIENEYHSSKDVRDTEPETALEGFQRVLEKQGNEKGIWGFKALKQIVKVYFKTGKYSQMLDKYKELLTYINSAVTRNESEKVITSILNLVSNSNQPEILQDLYETTLTALKDAKNERLWFSTTLKLGKLCFDVKDFGKLQKILKELRASCLLPGGEPDPKKDTQLLEVYALEIQLYTERKNNKKLKELYNKSLQVRSAIPHPRIMGVIRECGGKMHMTEREWKKAFTDFFEAFKNYDEAGISRRIQCLKYLVLANILSSSEINPFESQEAKPYKNDPEIVAMTNLVTAYENHDIKQFERILKNNRKTIMDDSFIASYIQDLLKNIRTQKLLSLIGPYTRIKIAYVSKELNISPDEVEELMVALILDNEIGGHIDQINGLLILEERTDSSRKYRAVTKWVQQLQTLQLSISSKVN